MFSLRSHFDVQFAGTDFILPFAIMNDGASVDLTGAAITIAIRKSGADVLTGSRADGTITTIEPSSCVAHFTASETANLAPGIYRITITVTDASGQVTRAHQGNLTVCGVDE